MFNPGDKVRLLSSASVLKKGQEMEISDLHFGDLVSKQWVFITPHKGGPSYTWLATDLELIAPVKS